MSRSVWMVMPRSRQRAHVGEDVEQAGDGDREAGLGGGLPDDGVVRVLAVVDGPAGQRPDAGGAGARRCADQQTLGRRESAQTAYAAILRSGSSMVVTGGNSPRPALPAWKRVGFLTDDWIVRGRSG